MEGPSLVILREEAQKFVGKRLLSCSGSTTKVDLSLLKGQKLIELASWGKHFLMCFGSTTLKVHFLMFGSYRIDQPKPGKVPRLSLTFRNGAIHLYSCSIQPLTEPIEDVYDWRVDVMSDQWDGRRVLRLLDKQPDAMVCDVLLDQSLFAGAGNIIKNEVLFNLSLHPETKVRTLTARERKTIVREVRAYSHQFYEWKKVFVLRKNWRIYRKRACAVCDARPVIKKTGQLDRVSFYCPKCQKIRRRLPRSS